MTCSRCGAEAVIRRDAAYYCGKCAVARDWGDVIAMVQAGSRDPDGIVFGDEDKALEPIAGESAGSTADPFAT